jgi:predicted nucleotidyltransferase
VSDLLQKHREKILALARERGVRNLRVFGSFARGGETEESDLDLLVLMDEGRDLLDLIAFLQAVRVVIGRNVDVIDERGLRPYVQDAVLRDAVPL